LPTVDSGAVIGSKKAAALVSSSPGYFAEEDVSFEMYNPSSRGRWKTATGDRN
jgi:hypothetical protein